MSPSRALLAAALLTLAAVAPVRAQLAWDTPSFLSPRPGDDLGIYFLQPDRADWGLVGIWRQSGSLNLGVRAGVVDPGAGTDMGLVVGVESYGLLLEAGPSFPVDVAWTLGFGAILADGTLARIPLGLSIGREVRTAGLTLVPYAHPRVGYDVIETDDLSHAELFLVTDLGLDVALGPSFTLRVGFTVGGDGSAQGVGVSYRMARGVEVR